MPGLNTTGLPNTADYNLGRGKVYFASLYANGLPKGYRDLGNAPEFKISIDVEKLDHKSSRNSLKYTDKEVVISQTVNCALTLDEINFQNLALLFSGETASGTNAAIAGFSERLMVADGALTLGTWYDIAGASNARAYDVDATKLTVTDNQAGKNALVKDTDYTLDAVMGRIFILSTSTVAAAAIAAGKGLLVTLTADATAGALTEVRGVTQANIKGALKFIAENPADDDAKTEFQFHQISLKSNGDFSLIGDEFTTMAFTGVAESNVQASSSSPTLTIRTIPQ